MVTIGNEDQNTNANTLLYCAAKNSEVFLTLSMYLRNNHILDGMKNTELAFIRLNIDPMSLMQKKI